MRVHVFGNSSSPAVATCRLSRTAQEGEREYGDARHFIERDFYVDDDLKSLPTEGEAIDLLKRTQAMLAEANLTLHKITSISPEVMRTFPAEDHAKDLKDLDLKLDNPPLQRSLGLHWDLKKDIFTFQVSTQEKPYTHRGVLSTVNSLYDPLGFVAPVIIQGRSLLRELSQSTDEWDVPLPPEMQQEWEKWKDSLKNLEQLHIPCNYIPAALSTASHKEICIFSEASEKAIAAVAYLNATNTDGLSHVGFIFGNVKLAP
ncbi:uncharacterized protein LOC115466351 isoform X1 [Microcaecilia unicolor]|uniref:Uncharacterized protein LOC115466351 isoform X1 n=1 Tax=Microcaecilia unicolor TaxID=1415580 RepID=A0A6P7XJN4_9AMPH|nr:uncharacterized protein LOC115466351 isoform X1 [Microcaecilia unicolor]